MIKLDYFTKQIYRKFADIIKENIYIDEQGTHVSKATIEGVKDAARACTEYLLEELLLEAINVADEKRITELKKMYNDILNYKIIWD